MSVFSLKYSAGQIFGLLGSVKGSFFCIMCRRLLSIGTILEEKPGASLGSGFDLSSAPLTYVPVASIDPTVVGYYTAKNGSLFLKNVSLEVPRHYLCRASNGIPREAAKSTRLTLNGSASDVSFLLVTKEYKSVCSSAIF